MAWIPLKGISAWWYITYFGERYMQAIAYQGSLRGLERTTVSSDSITSLSTPINKMAKSKLENLKDVKQFEQCITYFRDAYVKISSCHLEFLLAHFGHWLLIHLDSFVSHRSTSTHDHACIAKIDKTFHRKMGMKKCHTWSRADGWAIWALANFFSLTCWWICQKINIQKLCQQGGRKGRRD